ARLERYDGAAVRSFANDCHADSSLRVGRGKQLGAGVYQTPRPCDVAGVVERIHLERRAPARLRRPGARGHEHSLAHESGEICAARLRRPDGDRLGMDRWLATPRGELRMRLHGEQRFGQWYPGRRMAAHENTRVGGGCTCGPDDAAGTLADDLDQAELQMQLARRALPEGIARCVQPGHPHILIARGRIAAGAREDVAAIGSRHGVVRVVLVWAAERLRPGGHAAGPSGAAAAVARGAAAAARATGEPG